MHLTATDLVDLAEGRRDAELTPHVAACDRCRHELDELRATIALAATADVPEPSPLFWDQLSRRVREAIAADQAQSPGLQWTAGARWWPRWLVLVPASAVVIVAVAIGLFSTNQHRADDGRAQTSVARTDDSTSAYSAPNRSDLLSDPAAADDPSLRLVGDLAASMGWDASAEAGLASDGSADHAVAHLSPEELRALERLLKREMGVS
jgi:hypothetical protein